MAAAAHKGFKMQQKPNILIFMVDQLTGTLFADGPADNRTDVVRRLPKPGIEVPEEQLDGARDPATLSEEQLRKYGIRPNNRNRLYFTPGPDKVLESIPEGEVTVIVTYFRDRQPDVDPGTYSWTFTVQ